MTTMFYKLLVRKKSMLLMGIFVSSIFVSVAFAEEVEAQSKSESSVANAKLISRASNWHARNGVRIRRNWGVDVVGVRPVSSGFMLAFRYRIVDEEKAKLLNDKRSKAYIIDEATGNVLGVPIMEKLGEMRQKSTPEPGRTYFIMFGNPGKLVKSGSRVSVVVGDFRIDGLVVD